MGIDVTTVELMKRFKPGPKGASFGYPHFFDKTVDKSHPQRRTRSEHVFSDLGLPFPDCYDVGQLAGYDIKILDLNECYEGLPQYDYIINPGTIEHVFNIGQAVKNTHLMLKPGGLAFHHGSINRPRLGYWNTNITMWRAFCDAGNGTLRHFAEIGRIYYAVYERSDMPFRWPQENNVR